MRLAQRLFQQFLTFALYLPLLSGVSIVSIYYRYSSYYYPSTPPPTSLMNWKIMKQKTRALEPTAQQLQQEQLRSLGNSLKQVRLQKGLTFDAIEELTRIRKSLLLAIEQGDMAALPEPVYVRALLSRYGDALGLDGEAIANRFFTRPVVNQPRSSWRGSSARLSPLHLYGAYVLLIVGAVSALSALLQQNAPDMTAQPILDPAEIEQLTLQRPTPVAQPVVETPKQQQTKPIEVDLVLTEQSWIWVVADGQTKFEAILEQGEKRSWAADESMTIRVGNAGGVLYSFNQSQAELMGEVGMPVSKTFVPDVSLVAD
ncbi:RodZ domain-containing protein [cf. Phormidesmis sp. LEGE 11477]|uniref:helix-turn-helix domain-containing protein n=1 Tax=cf. Phormidesmis sp. LEGE 11477 TaxID=1828680 RepID=UPI00187EE2F1|nr:helix-turn-helix domain-containing protein [cf. Phormidesmis sp. LEGE 11477]